MTQFMLVVVGGHVMSSMYYAHGNIYHLKTVLYISNLLWHFLLKQEIHGARENAKR